MDDLLTDLADVIGDEMRLHDVPQEALDRAAREAVKFLRDQGWRPSAA